MRVVLKITVMVNHNRIHKKYPLPYHTETVTVTEINVRKRHGNGNGNRNMAKVPTLPAWYGQKKLFNETPSDRNFLLTLYRRKWKWHSVGNGTMRVILGLLSLQSSDKCIIKVAQALGSNLWHFQPIWSCLQLIDSRAITYVTPCTYSRFIPTCH